MVTRPFLQASAAIERVLKIRAAQSHLSNLASTILCTIEQSLLLIVLVHRAVETLQTEALNHLTHIIQFLVDDSIVFIAELTQHKIDLCAFRKFIANAEFDARIILGHHT